MDLVILAIQQLLKKAILLTESNLSDIKNVYYWDPINIPQSSLPALVINPTNSEYIQRGSRYDQKNHSIEIKLIHNAKSFFSENPEIEKVAIIQDSIKKIENTFNFETVDNSICGIIEKNFQLPYNWNNTCQLAKILSVNYNLFNTRLFPTYEVIILLSVNVVWNR